MRLAFKTYTQPQQTNIVQQLIDIQHRGKKKLRSGPCNVSCRVKSVVEITCFLRGVNEIGGRACISCPLHHHSYDRVVDNQLEFWVSIFMQLLHFKNDACDRNLQWALVFTVVSNIIFSRISRSCSIFYRFPRHIRQLNNTEYNSFLRDSMIQSTSLRRPVGTARSNIGRAFSPILSGPPQALLHQVLPWPLSQYKSTLSNDIHEMACIKFSSLWFGSPKGCSSYFGIRCDKSVAIYSFHFSSCS